MMESAMHMTVLLIETGSRLGIALSELDIQLDGIERSETGRFGLSGEGLTTVFLE